MPVLLAFFILAMTRRGACMDERYEINYFLSICAKISSGDIAVMP